MKTTRIALCLLMFCFSLSSAFGGDKTQVEILDSQTATSSYNVPARGYCTPNYLTGGENCGVRGAEVATVGWVRLKARLNNVDVWLTCNSAQKNCAPFNAGTYTAEPKGKDKLIVYGWRNPLYRGDLKKATKVTFAVGIREDVPIIKGTGDEVPTQH